MGIQSIHYGNKFQQMLPKYLEQLVPPIYLGQMPLPFKGVKDAFSLSLSGISNGGVEIVSTTKSTNGFSTGNKKRNGTSKFFQKEKSNNSKGISTSKEKKKSRGRIVGRNKQGKFVKGGK